MKASLPGKTQIESPTSGKEKLAKVWRCRGGGGERLPVNVIPGLLGK